MRSLIPIVYQFWFGLSTGNENSWITASELTPLMRAIVTGRADAPLALLHSGEDATIATWSGITPLMLAVYFRSPLSVIAGLIEKGASVNAMEFNRFTVFHFAAERSSIDVIQFLLAQGPLEPMTANIRGETPFQIAQTLGRDIESSLLAPYELLRACLANDREGLDRVMQYGLPIDYPLPEVGRSCIWLALRRCEPGLIQALLERGADRSLARVNEADSNGNIPLMRCIKRDEKSLMDFLVSEGTDLNHLNHFGESPLSYALRSDRPQLVKYLHDHGATISSVKDPKLKIAMLSLICPLNEGLIDCSSVPFDNGMALPPQE